VGLVKTGLAEDPLSGRLLVFVKRRGNDGKLVSWDRPGWWVFAKRLAQGRLHFPQAEAKPELRGPVFRLRWEGIALGGGHCMCEGAAMPVEDQAAALRPAQLVARLVRQRELRDQTAEVQRQVEGCTRQRCGRKSARRLRAPDPQQVSLSGLLTAPGPAADRPPPPTEPVKAYHRRGRYAATALPEESGLRVDASGPVQEILRAKPAVADLPPDAYEVIGEQGTSRLAQRPGAYLLLKDLRPVITRKETEALSCPPAPPPSSSRASRMSGCGRGCCSTSLPIISRSIGNPSDESRRGCG
jgi:IS66 Orf2 like protein